MKRSNKSVLAVAGVALAMPGLAFAVLPPAVTEVGDAGGDVKPACPAPPCKAIPRTTGYQVKVGEDRAVHVVKADGRVVAWTIQLSKPGPKQTAFFNENLGGEAQAQLTILRPGNKLYARVVAQGESVKLTKYFGQKVTFTLKKSIPVKKGNIIGITVPTWAPALALEQPGTTSWRASRGKGQCNDFDSQSAQTQTNNITRFYCLYRTARLAYSATVVADPKPK
ncbi:hypothetical protein DSM112329_03464 [Paraconexibacter sp. AEG42_29]|uniref:Uncharacterized protein n=1 Tax=Paraconexibacter sp. AEG42_29 TaxID=2997339 RepID=A0AAU7AYV8_9ACTN